MSATTAATPTVRTRRGLLVAAVVVALATSAAIGAAPATAAPARFPVDSNVTLVATSAASTASVVEYALQALNVPQDHIRQIEHQLAEGNL